MPWQQGQHQPLKQRPASSWSSSDRGAGTVLFPCCSRNNPAGLFAGRKPVRTLLPVRFAGQGGQLGPDSPGIRSAASRPLKRERGFYIRGATRQRGGSESWQRKSLPGSAAAPCSLRSGWKLTGLGPGEKSSRGRALPAVPSAPVAAWWWRGQNLSPPGLHHQRPSRTSPVLQEPMREIGQMNHFLRVPILGLHFKSRA